MALALAIGDGHVRKLVVELAVLSRRVVLDCLAKRVVDAPSFARLEGRLGEHESVKARSGKCISPVVCESASLLAIFLPLHIFH